jgi:predicted nucleic acid-binding protein
VFRFAPRFPEKQARAIELLRNGIAQNSIIVPHQAILEFVAAATKPLRRGGAPLLSPDDARREAEEMLSQFDVLYPDEEVVRTATRGAAAYRLSWFDAHIRAYAERFELPTLWSEDFEDGRLYGRVRAANPFL